MAKVVGFNKEIADKANAEKAKQKQARQRKHSRKQATSHVKFVKGAGIDNNPFATALQGVEVK